MTVTTHTITATTRSRLVRSTDGGLLVLREELRTLRGGQAWCIVGADLVDGRRRPAAWPA